MLIKIQSSELKEKDAVVAGPRTSNNAADKFSKYKGLIKPPPLKLIQKELNAEGKEERRSSDVVRTQSKSMIPNEEEDEKKEV